MNNKYSNLSDDKLIEYCKECQKLGITSEPELLMEICGRWMQLKEKYSKVEQGFFNLSYNIAGMYGDNQFGTEIDYLMELVSDVENVI